MRTNGPQHNVAIAEPFAVSKYEVTFADWDICVDIWRLRLSDRRQRDGDAAGSRSSTSPGTMRSSYVRMAFQDDRENPIGCSPKPNTNMPRAPERTTAYPWGDEIGKDNADCDGCGSPWDDEQTAPVGSFTPNAVRALRHGRQRLASGSRIAVHDNYDGAPADGSAWMQAATAARRVDPRRLLVLARSAASAPLHGIYCRNTWVNIGGIWIAHTLHR